MNMNMNMSYETRGPYADGHDARFRCLLGMVHGYGPSFTFAMGGPDTDRPLLSFDYYLDPKPTPEECAADLEELAAINFAAIGGSGPYFCVVHVREFSGISRVQKVLGLLDAQKFEVVPLDTFLAMASQNATFKTHFAEDGARRGEGQWRGAARTGRRPG